jgi:serine/threonine-protein phosphatase 2B regulatory subunit
MGSEFSKLSDSEVAAISQFREDDVRKLYNRFVTLDTDRSGQLEIHEILRVHDVHSNPVAKRVISVLDTNKNNKISFVEFLVGVARLTAATDPELRVKFFFDLYDVNGDGYISNGDLFRTLELMSADDLSDEQRQQLVDRTIRDADGDLDGLLTFKEFKRAVSKVKLEEKLTVEF